MAACTTGAVAARVLPQRGTRILSEVRRLQCEGPAEGFHLCEGGGGGGCASCSAFAEAEGRLVVAFHGEEGSVFGRLPALTLHVAFPPHYPFEAPHVTFPPCCTAIYHPNVDGEGRICLDLLRAPPGGRWSPAVTLLGLLQGVRVLLSHPNVDDPLAARAAAEYVADRSAYERRVLATFARAPLAGGAFVGSCAGRCDGGSAGGSASGCAGNHVGGNDESGNDGSGNRKSGDRESGDRESGDRKSGDRKSGDRKSGDRKSDHQGSRARGPTTLSLGRKRKEAERGD